jgi:hypothetical protein
MFLGYGLMSIFEEIKKYLPQYLSRTEQKALFKELESFPDNMSRIYTTRNLEDIFFQGDGVRDMMCVNFPRTEIHVAPVMIMSNTCDIDGGNIRSIPVAVVYAPILNLEKYKNTLLQSGFNPQKMENQLHDIKRQSITNIFYLPKGGSLEGDSIVFFDRTNNCNAAYLNEFPKDEKRLFILSQYGFYIFLVKLSIHFTRIREGKRSDEQIY